MLNFLIMYVCFKLLLFFSSAIELHVVIQFILVDLNLFLTSSFWEALAYMANTLIFFLVGMIVMQLMRQQARYLDFVYNFLIYISINAIRSVLSP